MTIRLGILQPSEPIDPNNECALGLWIGDPSSYQCAHSLLVDKGQLEQDCFSQEPGTSTQACDCQSDHFGEPSAIDCP